MYSYDTGIVSQTVYELIIELFVIYELFLHKA